MSSGEDPFGDPFQGEDPFARPDGDDAHGTQEADPFADPFA